MTASHAWPWLVLAIATTGCASLAGLDLDGLHERAADGGVTGGSGGAGGGQGGTIGTGAAGGSGGSVPTGGAAGSAGQGGIAGSGGTAGSGGGGGCTPDEKRCNVNAPEQCDAQGTWKKLPQACASPTPTCLAGACVTKPSCAGTGAGIDDCGSGGGSCCDSPKLPAGTFKRSYDGGNFTNATYTASVSEVRLDRYEVSVARFRKFAEAWLGGWRPDDGAGKHDHLNGGSGLKDGAAGGAYEVGWEKASWDAKLPTTIQAWDAALACDAKHSWASAPGSTDRSAINCVTWYDASAFCIWDGGFLPSEAEWNYAAAGGSEQRVYPFSSPASSSTIDCSYANFAGCIPTTGIAGVDALSPKGDGKWTHANLAGNVREWTQDWYSETYPLPCTNCGHLSPMTERAARGSDFLNNTFTAQSSVRLHGVPEKREGGYGIRCARVP
ncbi:MAG: SUMF1/EgtB/PvdO family nonheme iron enzyme [Myxococcales bacterium]|nr:SUMF1/EgtB/PvdO family nonheme iron enzyme [Myxococcales bacterium]